jgi:zinc transport system ATP-binding protein
MTSNIPILKVEGLTVYLGKYLALRDVSFQLEPGTNTAIVGPNGAGKIGYMPQNFIFDRSFPISVFELVALGWTKKGSWANKLAAVEQALMRTDALHLRNQAIGTLSGGQFKRVLLAYCLVAPRQLLILDEAFAGVDAQGTAEFYTLLNQIKQEQGWTILQVSHDIDMVNQNCDRVICLNQTVVCSGTPEFALSQENLLATYGPSFTRYHHQH